MFQPNHLFSVLLQAGDPPAGPSGSSLILLLAPLFLIWFFLVIRPSSKEKKLQKAMRASLTKGDRVLTQSGVIAKVHAVLEGEVVLNLDGTARMRVARETIVRRMEDDKQNGKQAGKNSHQASAAH